MTSQHLHPHVFGDGKTIVDPRRIINYARRMVLPCGLTMAGDDEWDPTQVLQGVSPDFWLRADQGVYLDGARQFYSADKTSATLASFAAVNLSTTDFSLVSSVYRDTTGNQVIAAKYQDANNYWRWEITAGHKLHFIAVVSGSTLIEVTGTTSLSTTATWYRAAVVVDRDAAGTTEIYLNGVNDTSGTPTVSASTIDNTGAFWLGQAGDDTLYWNGRIADIGVFKNDLLTQTEITWDYNSGNARVYGELGVVGTDGASLAPSWWANCNESSGTASIVDQASTNDLALTFAELLSNTGFETAGAGGADVFGSWVEMITGTGTITDEIVIVDAGGHAAELTGSDGSNYSVIYQDITTAGHRYQFSLRARNLVSGDARIAFVGSTATALVLSTSFTTFTGTVTAASATVQLDTYPNAVTAYFDTVSVKAVDIPAAGGPANSPAPVEGDPAASVTSLEGNSYSFAQSIASQRPYWRASAINEQPGLEFDSLDDLLTCVNGAVLTGTAFTTIAIWKQKTVPNSYQTLIATSDTAGATKYFALHARGNTANPHIGYEQRNADTADLLDGDTEVTDELDCAGYWSSSGTTISARLNGTAQTLAVDGGANNGDGPGNAETADKDVTTIGGLKHTSETNFAGVILCDLIHYPVELTAASRAIYAAYILARYGLVL